MAPAAFRATYSDLKVIKTRKCVQIIFELPLEQFDAAYGVLGGLPDPAAEHWFAIAALKQEVPGSDDRTCEPNTVSPRLLSQAKRSFRDLPASQQAGIRCKDAVFSAFLSETYPDEWHVVDADPASCVRFICNIASRSDLDRQDQHANRVIWHQLNSQFEAWKAKEHA